MRRDIRGDPRCGLGVGSVAETFLAVVVSVAVVASGCGTPEATGLDGFGGRWRLVRTTSNAYSDTITATDGVILDLDGEGRFRLEEPERTTSGSYGFDEQETGIRHGPLRVLLLSPRPSFFSPESVFVPLVVSDTLRLLSTWTDSWDRTFVRVDPGPRPDGDEE